MVSLLELRLLKSDGSNCRLPPVKAACICELLLGFFEKCAKRSAQYQKLYFDCDSRLYKMRKERKDVRPSSPPKKDLGLIDLAYRQVRELVICGFFLIQNLGQQCVGL